MVREELVIDWKDVLDKFCYYKGTIKDFCKENNISPHQLYYHRKRAKKKDAPTFHAVSFKKEVSDKATPEETTAPSSYLSSNIKIEIGKAKIYIPSNDETSLANILKVIMASC